MKKVLYSLLIIMALNTPAFAWTHLAFVTGGPATTTSPRTVNAWSSAQPGMTMIMTCADVLGGTLTPVATSNPWTQLSCTGSALPVGAGTFEINYWTRTVGTSEPATFGATFGDGGHTGCWIGYIQASDGTTPAIDACRVDFTSSSSGSLTNGALNTVTDDDFILGITNGAWGLNGLFVNAANPYATEWADGITFVNTSWNTGGFGTAGALPLVSYGFSSSGGAQALATIAFKNNATTAVNFIGRSAQTHTTGSPTSVTISSPTNNLSNTVDLVQVTQTGGSPGAIGTPSDIQIQADGSRFNNCSGCQTFTIPSYVQAGDMMLMFMASSTAMTAPASCGSNAWVQGGHVTAGGMWGKVAEGCDAGHSYSWTGFTGNVNRGFADYRSMSGGTLALDAAAAGNCTLTGSTNAPAPPTITTTVNNDVLETVILGQSSSATMTLPTGELTAWNNSSVAAASGWWSLGTAGTTPAQTYAGSATQTWVACQTAIKGSGAGTSYHSLGSQVASDSVTRIDAFWYYNSNSSSTITMSGSPAAVNTAIYDLYGLNSTTPFDVVVTEGDGANTTPIYPTLTPTSSDEAIFGISTLGGEQNANSFFWTNIISGQTNLGAQMNPLTLATGWPVTNQAPFSDGAQIVVGIHANTTPSLGTSHICINQAGYDLFANALITPPASASSVIGFVAQ